MAHKNMATLYGFFEDQNGKISWHVVDEAFNAFAIEQLDSVDTIPFGRVSQRHQTLTWKESYERAPKIQNKRS